MSRYDDNAGPARPARYQQPGGEYVPPKAAPRRPGADDALALPLSTTRRKQNMPPKILEEHTMQERRDKLLALLRDGPKHRRDIAVELHIAKGRTLDNLLTDLKSKGEIENDGGGTWSLVGMPDDEPPERAGHTDEPAGSDPPATEPTGDREDDPSPAAEGVDEPCYECGDYHPGSEACADLREEGERLRLQQEPDHQVKTEREVLDDHAAAVSALFTSNLRIDPDRVGILSDGTLILQTQYGRTIEVTMRGAMRAYQLMDTNSRWLRDLWQAAAEAQDK